MDLTVAQVAGQDQIFVTMLWTVSTQSEQAGQGLLMQYSLDGREQQKWSVFGRVLAGVAVDAKKGEVYLGDSSNAEILILNLGKGTARTGPQYFARVAGASRLGPITLDAEGHRLFAADVEQGKVYVIDLSRRKSALVASGLGEPSALTFSPTLRTLYVADAARRCIWQIQVDTAVPRLKTFSAVTELREPRGLAMRPDNTLWVADYGARAIFLLSPTGQVIQSIRH
ncbi:MAG: SMP-30/gluconolactonase/LRE family protein [Terriglobales bacterium]